MSGKPAAARVGLIIPVVEPDGRAGDGAGIPAGSNGACHAPAHDRRQSRRLRSPAADDRGGGTRARRRALRGRGLPLHGQLDGRRYGGRARHPRDPGARRGAASDDDHHRHSARAWTPSTPGGSCCSRPTAPPRPSTRPSSCATPATRWLRLSGFALAGSDAYCAAPPAFWRDRALAAAHPEADAYLISCANIAVFGVIEELEAKLGRPVVTSNQAVIWDALRLIGWREWRRCPGRLFAAAAVDLPPGIAIGR